MRNFRITFLIVGCLFVFGIYALARIPKQEFPEYTIRQGVVVGVYPGATAEEVEEQLAKPLEQFLMTYKEVKRAKTTSTSQNGMCYVMVELNDDVNDKDEVWSKVKHGLAAFKMQLPAGVAAVVTNDDFGDTSALLITLESDTRSYRELKGYMDDLSDRLRRIESVSNLRPYGVQQEQISVYVDPERLAAYGIGEKTLSAALAAQGLTPLGGSVSNAETETPIHIAPSLAGEREVAEQIVWSDPEGHVLRVKDVARVVREYDDPDSYIRNNGHRCVLLSLEMQAGNNIVEYGREVDEVLHAFIEEELPADVSVQRIADQAKVVGDSVHSFLRDLFVAMAIIIVVMMLLFPLRYSAEHRDARRAGRRAGHDRRQLDRGDRRLPRLPRARPFAVVRRRGERPGVLPLAAAGHDLYLHDLLSDPLHDDGHDGRLPDLVPVDDHH